MADQGGVVTHREHAVELLAESDTAADRDPVARAQVHATLYVGEWLEHLCGVFYGAQQDRATPAQPDKLAQEEAGLT